MPVSAISAILLPALSTAGTSQPFDRREYDAVSFCFASVGTTSGGTLIIEEAYYDPEVETIYSGTWSQIASVSASSFSGTAQIAYHVSPNSLPFLRVRISSAITGGGTVKVVMLARP